MTEAHRSSGDALDALDARLNVFALANGIDLRRAGEARVLEWYRDGLDRRVRLEPGAGEGTFALRASAARRGRGRDAEATVTVEAALLPEEIGERFPELLAGAVDAANAIPAEDLSERP